MEIEIGKEYMIYPKYKKSFVQWEYWKDNESNDRCRVESMYRSGSYIVKITNKDEKALLESYLADDSNIDCEPECDFEEHEFVECFDQCSCFFEPMLSDDTIISEEWLQENLEEEGEWWLSDNNWDCEDSETFMGTPLVADEVDPENRYNTRF
jgi:hypothetical protein